MNKYIPNKFSTLSAGLVEYTNYTPAALWPLFGLTGSRIGSIWSIGWSHHVLAHIYFLTNVLSNLLLQNNAQPFISLVVEGGS